MSANTLKSYEIGLSAFTEFLKNHNYVEIWPPSLNEILQFVAYLSLRNLSASTARLYVSAIAYKCKILGFIDVTKNFLVSKLLEGMHRLNHGPDTRLPITTDILKIIISALPGVCYNSFEVRLFKSAFTLAFWGLFRVGEITLSKGSNPDKIISNSDVQISNGAECIYVHLRFSKTDQWGKGIKIEIPKAIGIICPVESLVDYLKVRPTVNGPLFCHFNGNALSRYQFSAMLSKTLKCSGIEPSNYKSHSFRIGSASALFMAGYSEDAIKHIGRWKSTAYKSYIRTPVISVPKQL